MNPAVELQVVVTIQMDRHEIISFAIALTEHSEKNVNTFNVVQAISIFRKMHHKDRFQIDRPRVKKRGCYFLGTGGGSTFLSGRVKRSEVCMMEVSRISRRERRIKIGVVGKYHVRQK